MPIATAHPFCVQNSCATSYHVVNKVHALRKKYKEVKGLALCALISLSWMSSDIHWEVRFFCSYKSKVFFQCGWARLWGILMAKYQTSIHQCFVKLCSFKNCFILHNNNVTVVQDNTNFKITINQLRVGYIDFECYTLMLCSKCCFPESFMWGCIQLKDVR